MSINNQKIISKQLKPYHHDENKQNQLSSKQEEYFDIHVSKKKKLIFWIYLSTLLAFIVIVLTFISLAYKPIKQIMGSDNYYFSNQVVKEWNQGFITDIQVVKSTGVGVSCPVGYEHAFTFNWQGTGFGCLCQGGQNTTFVLEAYCSPALIQVNCKNIGSQDESWTHYWKNNSNICIKRSSVSFANQQKFNEKNKICGSSQSLVVVPNSEPCPLVNISLSSLSLEDHFITATDTDHVLPTMYASFNSTSPYSFYSYPITKFTVSEYQFCQMEEDTGLSPSHVDFVLLSVPRGCQQKGNYTQIDQITQLQFYTNNPKLLALTQINGFPSAGNWKYKLGFGSLPSWTYKCRHNLNSKFSIQNASKKLNFKVYDFLESASWVMIVCSIVIGVEIFVLGLRRCINNSIYPVGYKIQSMPSHFWFNLTRYIIDVICKILVIVMSALFVYNGYTDWHWFKQVQNYKCHHDNTQMIQFIIKPYQKVHLTIFKNGLVVLLVSIVMIIVDAFHFYYIYNNQLVFYIVRENQRLVDRDQVEGRKGDGVNDLKWLEMEDVEGLEADKNDDQLRITMAQNMFGYDDYEPQAVTRLKKKKKKVNKKLFTKDTTKQNNAGAFLFDDDIFGNIEQPSTTVLKPPVSSSKNRTINRRKK